MPHGGAGHPDGIWLIPLNKRMGVVGRIGPPHGRIVRSLPEVERRTVASSRFDMVFFFDALF
jgi:hypothetical protein